MKNWMVVLMVLTFLLGFLSGFVTEGLRWNKKWEAKKSYAGGLWLGCMDTVNDMQEEIGGRYKEEGKFYWIGGLDRMCGDYPYLWEDDRYKNYYEEKYEKNI